MVIDLIGVIEVGGKRAATVPVNTRRPIRFARGEDVRIRLTVVRSDGLPYNVTYSASTISFRPSVTAGVTLAKDAVFVANEGDGRQDFVLTSENTKSLVGARYLYDIWLTEPGSGLRHPIVGVSAALVDDAIRSL